MQKVIWFVVNFCFCFEPQVGGRFGPDSTANTIARAHQEQDITFSADDKLHGLRILNLNYVLRQNFTKFCPRINNTMIYQNIKKYSHVKVLTFEL